MVLHWDDRGTEVRIASVAELDRELDRLTEAAEPVLVRMYDRDDPSGPMLTVGVGGPRSTVGWTDRDGTSWMSKGDLPGPQPPGRFWYSGHVSEVPASALVQNESGRDAARRFFRDGDRPDNVRWEVV